MSVSSNRPFGCWRLFRRWGQCLGLTGARAMCVFPLCVTLKASVLSAGRCPWLMERLHEGSGCDAREAVGSYCPALGKCCCESGLVG